MNVKYGNDRMKYDVFAVVHYSNDHLHAYLAE